MWDTRTICSPEIRSLKFTDGPAGVRGPKWTGGTRTTFIPCGISLAATFDPALVSHVGRLLGVEAIKMQAHVLLAPTMNISRSPLGGRNFENFGEDPHLTGTLATSFISGVQSQGVGACMKHYVANDMETNRFNIDQHIDERTLREIYLKPFQMALAADPWTVMTAYSKVNGEHVDTSERLVRSVLRVEWSYSGLVLSDWGGLNSTINSMKATTDLEMPGPGLRFGHALESAVQAGELSAKEHIDPAVMRLLVLLGRAHILQPLSASVENHKRELKSRALDSNSADYCDDLACQRTAETAALAGVVLLKNSGVLPLDLSTISHLAIIGPNAKTPTAGGSGSASVNPRFVTTPYQSLVNSICARDPKIQISFAEGCLTREQTSLLDDHLVGNGSQGRIEARFYRGSNFEGEIAAISYWDTSSVFMMSDGDVPGYLRDQSYCYKLVGKFHIEDAGSYRFGLCNTGKAKLYIDDGLLIDNSNWDKAGPNFMNCGSVEKTARKDLSANRIYDFCIDNIATLPAIEPQDNTLFHTISGCRLGMSLERDEDAMIEDAVAVASRADVVIIVAGHNNDTEREGCDRTSILLPGRTNELIERVCKVQPSAIVITQSASAIAMPWSDAASAILHAWYQGQANGSAIASIVLGDTNPSGKLPITFPMRLEDHGSTSWLPADKSAKHGDYGERTLVGYRYFDAHGIQPLWPFGYGLTYSVFRLDNISVRGRIVTDGSECATITVTIVNTSDVAGSEVVQVYISPSVAIFDEGKQAAPQSLVAFEKVAVPAKSQRSIEMQLTRDAVAWYCVTKEEGLDIDGTWRYDPGDYDCMIGTSSRDITSSVSVIVENPT